MTNLDWAREQCERLNRVGLIDTIEEAKLWVDELYPRRWSYDENYKLYCLGLLNLEETLKLLPR